MTTLSPSRSLTQWRNQCRTDAEVAFLRLSRDLEAFVAEELWRRPPPQGQAPEIWVRQVVGPVVSARVAALTLRLEREALTRLDVLEGAAPERLALTAASPATEALIGAARAPGLTTPAPGRVFLTLAGISAALAAWLALGAPAILAVVGVLGAGVTWGPRLIARQPDVGRVARVQAALRRVLVQGPGSQLGLYLAALEGAYLRMSAPDMAYA